ncbi:hypothetical protein B0H17DRAFT_1072258 [Mycena rosella]|uniref:Uncharacterized protein n=1 Tax=Mycena rosella TaxID=1033263 RepID=A0AAD7DA11_MYCRO|nr:hypothetical protein B0H17DRAFT_1072258 [Mycena rosella]
MASIAIRRLIHCVEPLLYRTLIICKERGDSRKVEELPWCPWENFDRIVRRTESASFLRDSVRNGIGTSGRLGCQDPTGFPDSLRLRRLHCDNDDHPALKLQAYHAPGIVHWIEYNLYEDDPTQWSAVTRLPHLTHLSLNFKSLLAICPHLLDACKSLCGLIILRHSPAYRVPETLADVFIAKRRSGEIDRRTFFLEADAS